MEISLGDLLCIDCDSSGTLYGVTSAHSPAAGNIAVFDARQELLVAEQGKTLGKSGTVVENPNVSRVIQTYPPLSIEARSVTVSPNGRYLAVAGFEDEQYSSIVVVDLHGGRPVLGTSSTSTSNHGTSPSHKHLPCKQCTTHQVDCQLFQSRPGMIIHQVSWHPYSDNHLAVLTSDNRLRLYHLQDLSLAEQTFHLRVNCAAPSSGKYGLAAASAAIEVTAFSFAPPVGWGMFTVNLLASNGAVYALCPIAPFGMRCPASVLQQISATAEEPGVQSLTHTWLSTVFGIDEHDDVAAQPRWTARNCMLEGMAPAMQGPLNAWSDSLIPGPSNAVALCTSSHLDFHSTTSTAAATTASKAGASRGPQGAAGDLPVCATAVLTGFSDGRIFAHALLGLVPPSWLETSPQCILGPHGGVRAVRSDCEVVPLSSRDDACSLMLLDVIQVAATMASGTTTADSDEDDSPNTLQALATCGLPLRRLQLLRSQDAPHQFWACHETGCWNINLAWLPLVSQAMAKAAPQQRAAELEREMQGLPPPAVHELVAVEAQAGQEPHLLASCCALHDVFMGSGVLLLQQGQGRAAPAALHYYKPRSLSAMALEAGLTEAAQQVVGGKQVATAAAAARDRAGLVHSNIESVYGDLLAGPKQVALPKAKGPTGAGTPEGVSHLQASIHVVRQKHVEYLHRAHHDLKQRHTQLQSEAAAHGAAARELGELHGKVVQRQAQLAERVQRALGLHKNLADRLGLLTMLHWSLPRPMSEAEQQLVSELEVLNAKAQALTTSCPALTRRASRVLEGKQAALPGPGMGVGVGTPGPAPPGRAPRSPAPEAMSIPPAQVDKVHASILQHYQLVSSCSHELKLMEGDLKTWKQVQSREAVSKDLAASPSRAGQ